MDLKYDCDSVQQKYNLEVKVCKSEKILLQKLNE
jgi:hypothetical protein